MQFTLPVIAAFATLALALPNTKRDVEAFNAHAITSADLFDLPAVEPTTLSISKRAPYQFILCKDANFGQCVSVTGNTGGCVNVGADYNDVISSLQNPNSFSCTVYQNGGCSGGALIVNGRTSSPTIPAAFNDQISSFRCG